MGRHCHLVEGGRTVVLDLGLSPGQVLVKVVQMQPLVLQGRKGRSALRLLLLVLLEVTPNGPLSLCSPSEVLKAGSSVHPALLKQEVEAVRDKQRSPAYCDQLLQHIQSLPRDEA